MKRTPLALVPLVALVVAACGSDDSVAIDSPWARTSAAGQTTGAIYFELTVDADDRLVGASVPASIAAEAEVHEVIMVEGGDMDDMSGEDDMDEMSGEHDMDDADGMEGSDDMDDMDDMDMGDMGGQMRMQEIAGGLELTAGETVTFEPGGYHIMLLDIAEPLESGDEIDLTLEFAEAGEQSITVEVRETAP